MKPMRFNRLERRRVGGTRDRMELSYAAPKSPSGKVYQYSPNPAALPRLFLIGDAPEPREIANAVRIRMQREPGKGQTVCPYSGFIADDEDFVHFEDVEAVKKQVEYEVLADVEDQLAEMAKNFNRGMPSGGLIDIKMDVPRGHRPRPLAIREDLLRNLSCPLCQRSYAVYAIGLFCPDCGAPNVHEHFQREVDLISRQVALADTSAQSGDEELAYRLMGNAHEDVLTAFEATMKAVYRFLVQLQKPKEGGALATYDNIGTSFQRIDKGRKLYREINVDPFASLSAAELDDLGNHIQKRHIIGHNLSVADERFASQTDQGRVGETVKIIGEDINAFASICSRVVAGLDGFLTPIEKTSNSKKAEN